MMLLLSCGLNSTDSTDSLVLCGVGGGVRRGHPPPPRAPPSPPAPPFPTLTSASLVPRAQSHTDIMCSLESSTTQRYEPWSWGMDGGMDRGMEGQTDRQTDGRMEGRTHGAGEGQGAHAALKAAQPDLLQRQQRGRIPDVNHGLQGLQWGGGRWESRGVRGGGHPTARGLRLPPLPPPFSPYFVLLFDAGRLPRGDAETVGVHGQAAGLGVYFGGWAHITGTPPPK